MFYYHNKSNSFNLCYYYDFIIIIIIKIVLTRVAKSWYSYAQFNDTSIISKSDRTNRVMAVFLKIV